MDYLNNYRQWLNASWLSAADKQELAQIADKKTLEDMFYTYLDFGTAGMRGIMGLGTNRMNIYMVRRVSQGFGTYIAKMGYAQRGVAIAFDSRKNSQEFAVGAAEVLAANGIRVYLYDTLRPVSYLSFAVRHLQCIGGIVITASHNPKEYNGYKIYWEDGGQIPPLVTEKVTQEITAIQSFGDVQILPLEKGLASGMIQYISPTVDEAYLSQVLSLITDKNSIPSTPELQVVYTPVHGTGNFPVRAVLAKAGLANLHIVPQQELPDPDFSTVSSPNPEDPATLALAMQLGEAVGADLVFGTDPDCDRISTAVKIGEHYQVLSGNQLGCVLLDYYLGALQRQGKLPPNGVAIKTIVTTELARKIAESYGIAILDVLTGFKFIGEKILEFETTNEHTYLFGFEESCGYLAGTFVRDKDAVIASVLTVEAASYYKKQSKNLNDALQQLFRRHGYYKESSVSLQFDGMEGSAQIQKIMTNCRTAPKDAVAGLRVLALRDYATRKRICYGTMDELDLDLPQSDVLYLELERECYVVIRPSGTEPKLKIYIGVAEATQQKADTLHDAICADMTQWLYSM